MAMTMPMIMPVSCVPVTMTMSMSGSVSTSELLNGINKSGNASSSVRSIFTVCRDNIWIRLHESRKQKSGDDCRERRDQHRRHADRRHCRSRHRHGEDHAGQHPSSCVHRQLVHQIHQSRDGITVVHFRDVQGRRGRCFVELGDDGSGGRRQGSHSGAMQQEEDQEMKRQVRSAVRGYWIWRREGWTRLESS